MAWPGSGLGFVAKPAAKTCYGGSRMDVVRRPVFLSFFFFFIVMYCRSLLICSSPYSLRPQNYSKQNQIPVQPCRAVLYSSYENRLDRCTGALDVASTVNSNYLGGASN